MHGADGILNEQTADFTVAIVDIIGPFDVNFFSQELLQGFHHPQGNGLAEQENL
jgi:hypothetical protein